MNPLRWLTGRIDRWADHGISQHVGWAIGPGTKHPERSEAQPPRASSAPGHTPDGGVGSPPGPVAATSGLPDPPPGDRPVAAPFSLTPPPGTPQLLYTERRWSCRCRIRWDRERRPLLLDLCEMHTDLREWDEEMSR